MTKKHFVSNISDQSNQVTQVTNEIVIEEYNPENSSSDDSDEESDYEFLDDASENIEIKTHLEMNEDKSTECSPLAKQINVLTENGVNKEASQKSDGPKITSVHGSVPKDILVSICDRSSNESKNKSEKVEQKEAIDFLGAIFQVYYCDLCDTAFLSEDYVERHLQNYHRFLKNDTKFIRQL